MHDCPSCGEACDCDGEDTWHDRVSNCDHECEPEEDDYDGPEPTVGNEIV